MKIFLIVIIALFGSIYGREQSALTTRENEIRLGSCGDPMGEALWLATVYKVDGYKQVNAERERTKPRKTSKAPLVETTTGLATEMTTTEKEKDDKEETTIGVEGSTSSTGSTDFTTTRGETSTFTTTTEKVVSKYQTTNAVFISQTHLLLASSWFLQWNGDDKSWHWKLNTTRVDDSDCKKNKTNSFRTRSTFNHVMDYRGDWRKVEEIVFLRFCEYKAEQRGFLALIVVNRTVPPIPTICLPKAIDKKQTLRITSFKRSSVRRIGKLGNVTKCMGDHGIYYNAIGDCTPWNRGSPMVTDDSFGVQRLHGLIAIENPSENPFYHIIQDYMDELCELMNICQRNIERIGLTPGKDDEKFRKSIDDDYAEQLEEPDILEYNGKEKQMTGIGLTPLILMFWLLK